jgi:2-oxoacid:acceptor oxidoreductase gamma subunit (pyruvate/2-ketoisovalerate family)
MLEIRFHGRGGQGTVNAAQMLTRSLVKNGKYAQFIPAFGVERKGSPVYGYFRLDDAEIRPKNQVYFPDGVVVLDDSLFKDVDIYHGMKQNSFIVLNTKETVEEVAAKAPAEVREFAVLDATSIAREIVGREIPNTVVLGALAKLRSDINVESLKEMISEKYGEKNGQAFLAGHEQAHILKR